MTDIKKLLSERILVLDGAMGTMIQRHRLTENDYRGQRFVDHDKQLTGNNDLLCITQPSIVSQIHREYIEAGADIITTNTFNANAISQCDYDTSAFVPEINMAAACLARREADAYMSIHPDKTILVAGSVGPTNRAASISPRVDDPAFRNVDFDELTNAYRQQVKALVDGGVDVILFETVFDTLNLKAGLEAVRIVSEQLARDIPVMVSATIAGRSGRILSGQTISALWTTIAPYDNIISFGLNCSWGARDMLPYITEAATLSDKFISCHPNAGIPDENGEYAEPAEHFAEAAETMMKNSAVNIIGGCCGTTPYHTSLLAKLATSYPPRKLKPHKAKLQLAGLDALTVSPENNFINIGERCNVAGSRKFLRLIKDGAYDDALAIARKQVDDGAQILDINMDDSMIDAQKKMVYFLRLIASDPETARVPLMIDSSDWNVLEAGLKNTQGRSIVNSISLKEGVEEFIRKAHIIQSLGAAVVVMCFDEDGQADTYERKIYICQRAYRLLIDKAGFHPEDIIFDPNIMAVATGIEEHDTYARDYIKAVAWIKANLPGAKVSGGVSNLSFAFRGHNSLREAMHAVFLYHAIKAGLDMAIINPSSTLTYNDVNPELRKILDDLFINGSHDAAEHLMSYAGNADNISSKEREKCTPIRTDIPLYDRLRDAIIKGDDQFIADDLVEAEKEFSQAIDIINGPLMEGVSKVGELFSEGKMFLPQVVKTARVMKKAVDCLRPRIETENYVNQQSTAGTILFATVKGDVHDIGKNIVSIVLECNNYHVIDLGVMVPAETIVERAIAEKPDVICLSGLITPSLGEMVNVADQLEAAGLNIPLIVGGATTSKLHTALKIAPHLSAPVIHAADASQNPLIISKLLNNDTRNKFILELAEEYEQIRREHSDKNSTLLTLVDARKHKMQFDWANYSSVQPSILETIVEDLPFGEVTKLINWKMFFNFWKMNGEYIEDFPFGKCSHCRAEWLAKYSGEEKAVEALKLYEDALAILQLLKEQQNTIRAAIGFYEAYSDSEDNIYIGGIKFPMIRRQATNANAICLCASDFVMPKEFISKNRKDYVGAFAVSVSAPELVELYSRNNDNYSLILLRSLLDRLAEAGSEYLHRKVRKSIWGYSADENLSKEDLFAAKYNGIRPAIGYPMIPDQTLNLQMAEILPLDKIGVSFTENGAMMPTSTVCGLYIAHPSSKYFLMGEIDKDQIEDYARRRGITCDKAEKLLVKNVRLN